jgi:hypothetical protein
MKPLPILLLCALALPNLGRGERLTTLDWSSPSANTRQVYAYCDGPSGAKVAVGHPRLEGAPGEGRVLAIQILAPSAKSGPYDIQVGFTETRSFKAQARYQVRFLCRSDRPVRFEAFAHLAGKPYTRLGDAASVAIPGTSDWREVAYNFICRSANEGQTVRMPDFAMGALPAGTTVWISRLVIEELPFDDAPLDLSAAANMGFQDDVAGDGKGGWSDQGSTRDFGTFDLTRSDFSGVRFSILDPQKNGGRSVLVFKSKHIHPAIDVGERELTGPGPQAKGRFLYLLHTAAWAMAQGTPLGKATVELEDGVKRVFEILPGRELGDWKQPNPKSLSNGIVAYRETNRGGDLACVFLSKFDLGADARAIRRVTLTALGEPIWIVVGATLSCKDLDMAAPIPTRIVKAPRLLNVARPQTKPLLAREGDLHIVTPPPSTRALINPGKGWVLYGKAPELIPEVLAIGTVGYGRFQWQALEPEEGKFKWDEVDAAIAAWSNAGKKFAFGVMCANTHSKVLYVTPEWVFKAGAKFQDFTLTPAHGYAGNPGRHLAPLFDDPVFMAKMAAFVRAMAKRYDGHPAVEFIDIRSFGNWGEGHMYPFPTGYIGVDMLQKHYEIHREAFKKTRLIGIPANSRYDAVYDWAVKQGIGMRSDGIVGPGGDGRNTARAAGLAPAVFEFMGSYEWLKSRGTWDGKNDGIRLVECVETGMPTYIGLSQWGKEPERFYAAEKPLIEELANRMGYHLVILEARYPAAIAMGSPAILDLKWENQGVARPFLPLAVSFALLSSDGRVVARIAAKESSPGALVPDKPAAVRETLAFPKVPTGDYSLAVGVFEAAGGELPTVKLGVDLKQLNGWYVLGPVAVK